MLPSVLMGALLLLLVWLVYAPSLNNGFVNLDDNLNVYENPVVREGLTPSGVWWALTSVEESNWYPVTRLSHLLTVEAFGMRPWGHHLVNLLIHAAASLLLFLMLTAATGESWPSLMVAALFAVHPVHVESVAWISERKDVLSAFFMFLTMMLYISYVRRRTWRRSAALLACFALGLASKPMVVTLPIVLLLFDYWPLRRWQGGIAGFPRGIVLEKAPLLILSAASSAITLIAQAQGGAVATFAGVPPLERVVNAFASVARYLAALGWPSRLAVFYPRLPPGKLVTLGAIGLVLTVLISWLVIRARRHPYLAVGWAYFLVTLLPVLGLIQVGGQSIADRYLYIPSVGLYCAVCWGLANAVQGRGRLRLPMAVAATGVICALALVARHQVAVWKGEESLYRHALAVTEGNWVANANLGSWFLVRGETKEAMEYLSRATAMNPNDWISLNNLGLVLLGQGRAQEAVAQLRKSIALAPAYARARNNLGAALSQLGMVGEAEIRLREALLLDPGYSEARENLAFLLLRLGRAEEALQQFDLLYRGYPEAERRERLRKIRQMIGGSR